MTTSNMCPECAPHGGQGRVLLLDSWVDCTFCAQPLPGCSTLTASARATRTFSEALCSAVIEDRPLKPGVHTFHIQGTPDERIAVSPRAESPGKADLKDFEPPTEATLRERIIRYLAPSRGTPADIKRCLTAHGIFGADIYENHERKAIVIVVDELPGPDTRESIRAELPVAIAVEFAIREKP